MTARPYLVYLITTLSFQDALNDSLTSNSHLKDENTLLKAQVSAAPLNHQAPSQDDAKLKEYEAKMQNLADEVARLNGELNASREAQKTSAEELEKLKKDQEDLLVLLVDQDAKLNEYKMRLMSLGQPVDEPTEENLT
ncbi:general vesicular transport factor p115-like [Ostrinia furnacalis]|uniref:general vesicular transport factor p115-like n=1 Tax=Ostrinia furnacalis TaxID=93504 RepID=UPI001038D282|nr:general vesicular transport factor p115-like [Ostrinia furnacalis]